MNAYKDGLNAFPALLTFKGYKPGETILKLFFMPLALPLCALLYALTAIFYTVERIFSPVFRRFLIFQIKMMQTRAQTIKVWTRRAYGLLNVIVTLLMLPFITIYFVAILLKMFGKYCLRTLVLKLDYAVRFTPQDIPLFDDAHKTGQSPMAAMMHDAQNTESIGKILEQYVNQVRDDESSLIDVEDDDEER